MFAIPDRVKILSLLAIASSLASPASAGYTFGYSSFDPPAGVDSPVGDSQASGISNNGVVIGTYYSADSTAHGYERVNGVYTTFDAPGAGTGNYAGTYGNSVNSSGQAVFQVLDNADNSTSILYSGGHYTALVDPLGGPYATLANSINDAGMVTGIYEISSKISSFQYVNGIYTTLPNVPNAASTSAQATASNGDVLVNYTDAGGRSHGALDQGGVYTTFYNVPGATETNVYGINASGWVGGSYVDAAGNQLGFEDIGGTYYTLDFPGSVGTQIFGINDAGQVAGYWYDSSYEAHSLVVTPSAVSEPSSLVLLAGMTSTILPAWLVRRRRCRPASGRSPAP